MSDEEWRRIDRTSYEVSSHGRVRNKGRNLIRRAHSNGYLRVTMCAGGEKRDFYIHRLVCRAFHGPAPAPDSHADHIDGDRANNRRENLRWLAPEANRALRNHARGERNGAAKLTGPDVVQIKRLLGSRTNLQLSKSFGVARRTIADIRNQKRWSHINVGC